MLIVRGEEYTRFQTHVSAELTETDELWNMRYYKVIAPGTLCHQELLEKRCVNNQSKWKAGKVTDLLTFFRSIKCGHLASMRCIH